MLKMFQPWILLFLFITLSDKVLSINPEFDLRKLSREANYNEIVKTSWNTKTVPMTTINLPVPLKIYNDSYESIDVYSNGYFALQTSDFKSVPSENYPTKNSDPLQAQNGNFYSVLSIPAFGGSSGTVDVIVRDLKGAQTKLTNQERLHLERNKEIINQIWMKSKGPFEPNFMVIIMWKNLTSSNQAVDQSLTNTFSVLILSDGKKSFIEHQYNKIEWMPKDLKSLLILSGLFCQNYGIQLPLSGVSHNPDNWNSESNIALPGEWLLPLYESKETIEESQVESVKMISEKIWKDFGKIPCGKNECSPFAECVDSTAGFCLCQKGYNGDGVVCSSKDSSEQVQCSGCEDGLSKCALVDGVKTCICDDTLSIGGNDVCIPKSSLASTKVKIEGKMLFQVREEKTESFIRNTLTYNTNDKRWNQKSMVSDLPSHMRNLFKLVSPVFQTLGLIMDSPWISEPLIEEPSLFSLLNGFEGTTRFNFSVFIEGIDNVNISLDLYNVTKVKDTVNIALKGSLISLIDPNSIKSYTFDDHLNLHNRAKYTINEKGVITFRRINYSLIGSDDKQNETLKVIVSTSVGPVNEKLFIGRQLLNRTLERNAAGSLFTYALFEKQKINENCIDDLCSLSLESVNEEKPEFLINNSDIVTPEFPYIQDNPYNCADSECDANDAKCYEYQGVKQCICNENFFGGIKKCVSSELNRQVSFNAIGDVKISLSGSESNSQMSINILTNYANKEISAFSKFESVSPNDEPTMRLLNPILHTMDALLATPNRNCKNGMPRNSRIFNLFSLFDGFKDATTFIFDIKLERFGSVMVDIEIKNNEIYNYDFRNTIIGTIRRGSGFQRVSKIYNEIPGPSESSGNSYYSAYKMNAYGVDFDKSSITFQDEESKENITVTWTASVRNKNGQALPILKLAEIDNNQGSLYLKYNEKSYCESSCQSSCTIQCRDDVSLLKSNPSPCDCEVCQKANEKCYPRGTTSYYCDCAEGYERDANNYCTSADKNQIKPVVGELCGDKYCSVDAKCLDRYSSKCQCVAGYRGDGFSCTEDPCSRCRPDEVCRKDQCIKPPEPVLCNGVYCAPFASCKNGLQCQCPVDMFGDGNSKCTDENEDVINDCNGNYCAENAYCDGRDCVCRDGYEGNPYSMCNAKSCGGHKCAENAECENDYCNCKTGFMGDGYVECVANSFQSPEVSETNMLCGGHKCGSNAICSENICTCPTGYEGYAYDKCVEIKGVQCGAHICAENAHCVEEYCICMPGYTGFGYSKCDVKPKMPCDDVRCGYNAECQADTGVCLCKAGFEGDPTRECSGVTEQNPDNCYGRRCGTNAVCDSRMQKCVCDPNFEGDPEYQCTPMIYSGAEQCAGQRCGENAQCDNYTQRCTCNSGFTGDPYTICQMAVVEDGARVSCGGHKCALNAYCENEYCYCSPGYDGFGYAECKPLSPTSSQCTDTCHIFAECKSGRCQCLSGYVGDGVNTCENACGGRRCHENAYCEGDRCVCNPGYFGNGEYCSTEYGALCRGQTCDVNAFCEYSGCKCKPGFTGDGVRCLKDSIVSQMNCPNCGQNTECNNGVCQCKRGYEGDPYAFCTKAASFDIVEIERSSEVITFPSSIKNFKLVCIIRDNVRQKKNFWSPILARSRENIIEFSNQRKVELIVDNVQANEDATMYTCSADGMRDQVMVKFKEETQISIPLLVSSDNGISKVNHTGQTPTTAKLWKLASGMKYQPVSIDFNKKSGNAFYTDDDHMKIMFADSKTKIATSELIHSDLKIRSIRADSASSNIYALTFNNSMFVVAENKPGVKYDLEGVANKFRDTLDVEIVNFALNPAKGLMYLAVKSLKSPSTIHVFKMNGEYVEKLTDLQGTPTAISYGRVNHFSNDYGRLCTLQRMFILSNEALKSRLHCFKLNSVEDKIESDSNSKDFYAQDLPAGGLLQLDNMIVWTVSNSRSYHTLSPNQQYLVKHVCCSVRFQNIVDARIDKSLKSACTGDTSCSTVCLPTSPTKRECA